MDWHHAANFRIVDLPGFRCWSLDDRQAKLSERISQLATSYMQDPNNIILCVEQAGDLATMSSLARAQDIDPGFDRTVLVLSKLDKYYTDLSCNNVNEWITGHGNLPEGLVRFAISLP